MLIWKQSISFSQFNSVYSENCRGSALKTGHNHFLPHTFQFIIHQEFYQFYTIYTVTLTNLITQTELQTINTLLLVYSIGEKSRKQKSSAWRKSADGLVLAMSELQPLIPTCCFNQQSCKSPRVNVCWKIKYWRYKLQRVLVLLLEF